MIYATLEQYCLIIPSLCDTKTIVFPAAIDQKQRIKKRSLETASDTDAEQDSKKEASSIGNKSLFHDKKKHLFFGINTYLLPFLAILGYFLFVNAIQNKSLSILIAIAMYGTFFLMFVNVKSYFENNMVMVAKTHLTYTFIKYIIWWLFACYFISIYYIAEIAPITRMIITLSGIFVVTFIIIYLIYKRNGRKTIESIPFSFMISAIIAIVTLMSISFPNLRLETGIMIASFIFYLAITFIHHYLHRNLTKDLMIEYLLFTVLFVGLVYGIKQ